MYFIGNLESGTTFSGLTIGGRGNGVMLPHFTYKQDSTVCPAIFYNREDAVELLEDIKSRNPNDDSSVHPIEALAQLK